MLKKPGITGMPDRREVLMGIEAIDRAIDSGETQAYVRGQRRGGLFSLTRFQVAGFPKIEAFIGRVRTRIVGNRPGSRFISEAPDMPDSTL